MTTRPFDFDSPSGYRLSGRIDLPDKPARGWALFAHCFTCGKDGLAAVRIGRSLARSGIGVLRFDFAGNGTSESAEAELNFASDVRDLAAAAEAMSAAGMPPSLLIGHSLGGAAVLVAAGDIPSVSAVATIGAPFDVEHVLLQVGDEDRAMIEADGAARVQLAGRAFTLTKRFIDELRITILARASRRSDARCLCCMPRATKPSESPTRPASSWRRTTRKASCRWMRPTTC